MTLRITPQMLDNSTVSTIDNDLNQLDQTQEELSTGYQINEPSDDPFGAAETLSLQDQISSYSSYTTNINQGLAMVETASDGLQSILQVTQTVSELAEEAANGTENATDLTDAAQEVEQYIGQIKETADTQYDGSYIFSGDDMSQEPYDDSPTGSDTYQGNTNAVSYSIGPSTTLQVNADLSSVLGNGSSSGTPTSNTGGDGGLLDTLRNIQYDLENDDQSDLATQISNLQDNMSSLESLQATVGSTQDRLEMASSRMTSLTETDTTELGDVYDTDEATAETSFTTEQASYEAALESTSDIIQTSLLNYLED